MVTNEIKYFIMQYRKKLEKKREREREKKITEIRYKKYNS